MSLGAAVSLMVGQFAQVKQIDAATFAPSLAAITHRAFAVPAKSALSHHFACNGRRNS